MSFSPLRLRLQNVRTAVDRVRAASMFNKAEAAEVALAESLDLIAELIVKVEALEERCKTKTT